MMKGLIKEMMKVDFLNVSSIRRISSSIILIPLEELENLIIKISYKKATKREFHTHIYLYISAPLEAYRKRISSQLIDSH